MAESNVKVQPISIRLTETAREYVDRICEMKGISITAVVEMAVREYGERELGITKRGK